MAEEETAAPQAVFCIGCGEQIFGGPGAWHTDDGEVCPGSPTLFHEPDGQRL